MQKVFITSLHRVGTQSTDQLLRQSGYTTIHWPARWDGQDFQAPVVGHETDFAYVTDRLKPVIDAHDAISDVPICALYEALADKYPEAAFVALRRPVEDWIRSVRRHIKARALDPFEHTMYWRYVASRPRYIADVSDAELTVMHRDHYTGMAAFFEGSGRYLCEDLTDPECGQKLCAFLGLPLQPLPNTDYLRGFEPMHQNTAPQEGA